LTCLLGIRGLEAVQAIKLVNTGEANGQEEKLTSVQGAWSQEEAVGSISVKDANNRGKLASIQEVRSQEKEVASVNGEDANGQEEKLASIQGARSQEEAVGSVSVKDANNRVELAPIQEVRSQEKVRESTGLDGGPSHPEETEIHYEHEDGSDDQKSNDRKEKKTQTQGLQPCSAQIEKDRFQRGKREDIPRTYARGQPLPWDITQVRGRYSRAFLDSTGRRNRFCHKGNRSSSRVEVQIEFEEERVIAEVTWCSLAQQIWEEARQRWGKAIIWIYMHDDLCHFELNTTDNREDEMNQSSDRQ
jgi:hypothetical protein